MAELFARDTIKNLRKLRHLKPDLFKGSKELMAVTAAHVTQCMWCIEDHVKRAQQLGAADEEIAEAAFVAMALRAGGAFAHACIGMAVLEEHKGPGETPKG